MKFFGKVLNKSVWSVITLFLAILLAILFVATPVLKENESNINYALGINPYHTEKKQDSDSKTDTEYFKSPYKTVDGSYDDKAMREASMAVSIQAASEGAVLLWNDNNALPLADGSKLSFFGVSSRANSWMYSGGGSGHVWINVSDTKDLKAMFEWSGEYEVNPKLWNSYADRTYWGLNYEKKDDPHYIEFSVNEKEWSAVQNAAGSTFASYGDAAVYFISRYGSEDGDTWYDTSIYHSAEKYTDNNYLDLTQNEKDTLAALCAMKGTTFQKVVVVLNTGAAVQMQTLADYDIDACVWVGMGGSASLEAVYNVLSGKTNPSGRLVDTYVYQNNSAPSTVNTGAYEFTRYGDLPTESRNNNSYNHAYIVYQEGIYVGYRYYETRYEDYVLGRGNADGKAGVVNGKEGWKWQDEVKFPFGYGLSYTTFEYSDYSVDEVKDGFSVKVTVKNVGKVAGATPIQVYMQKPYTDYDIANKVEKSAIDLVGYAKTDVLQPQESKTYTVFVNEYEMKSYDSYGQKTYILEKGDYYIAVGKDSHDALNNILAAKGRTKKDGMVDSLGKPADGNKNLCYKHTEHKDDFKKFSVSNNGTKVTNRFDDTDINLYAGTADQKITYLSRSDWDGTYPVSHVTMHARNKTFVADMQYAKSVKKNPDAKMPIYDTVTNPSGRLALVTLRGLPYDNEIWDDLLNQLSWKDTVRICGLGNHEIRGLTSVTSPQVIAHDGPAGISSVTPDKYDGPAGKDNVTPSNDVTSAMAFPTGVVLASTWNDSLVEDVCKAFGTEMLHIGVVELYGPGAGIHRSAYGGRNWEYFSEDGFISGRILAAEVKGLQSMGAIVNIKHFVLNDQEIYRCGTTTWANEQSIREIYLKAFEAAVTDGKANGIMSSLNRLGCTWAGKHEGLLTDVLRNEWGFIGFVETDAASGFYMKEGNARAEAIVAGNDLWLRGAEVDNELWGDYKNNATVAAALRESAHRLLYVVANSAAMNGYDTDTVLVYDEPFYFGLIGTAQIVVGALTALSACALICSFVLPKTKFKNI